MVGPEAWSRQRREAAFLAVFNSPEKAVTLPRHLRKEVMTLVVLIAFVTFTFVPWKANYPTRPTIS